jgi:hypothetical protein
LTRARESLRVALADERRQEQEREAAIDTSFAERARAADARHRPDDTSTGTPQ